MLNVVPPGIRSEVIAMNIKTRRRLAMFLTCAATLALYGTAAYRVEQARQLPREYASCNYERCIPHSATLNALR
ncbi:hypothetical protein CEQ51_14040 [Pseudomonas thivervalensis]|uniref:Uncharacterized protein n=2 Tax=Pseudomonas thivervalensis TaxID=86265 RepID=A0A176NIW9_9PSED|nr:hypothetical protein CE140_13485 [Pseudomonas thivervalensis]AXA61147.1 hypothetical protein CEQ51_14040 [Pseudomonas thivervalensis]OAB51120.1 hypothetical protein APS14_05480 [Pseudomonas thivervalensis]